MSHRSETVPPPDPAGIYLPLAGGTMSGTIAVSADNTIDLGSSGNRWRTIYTHLARVTNKITVGTDPGGFMIDAETPTTGGQDGTYLTFAAGTGAAATVGNAAGAGGEHYVRAGTGGAGTAARVSGAGGSYHLDAGAAGADNGGGAGANGSIYIGQNNTAGINLGAAGTPTIFHEQPEFTETTGAALLVGLGTAIPTAAAGSIKITVGGTTYAIPYFRF